MSSGLLSPRKRKAAGRRRRGGQLWRALLPVLLAGGTAFFLWSEREQFQPFIARMDSASVPAAGGWELYFSPQGGATDAVVREIGSAKKRIRVQAYYLTSAPIAKALGDAKVRGVDVRVILDKSQQSDRYTSATYLAHRGVPVLIDSAHAIAHDKVMIFDGQTVITGSFNFTQAAEKRNAENLLILRDAEALATRYEANWELHAAHSAPYEPSEDKSTRP